MTEVKTIGDYINALPDEIREEVRRLNKISDYRLIKKMSDRVEPMLSMFIMPDLNWYDISKKYTLTEKEGKYYTNW